MRLSAVVDIVGGELAASTFVTSFENIRIEPARVTREDLFIATNNEEIPQAVENGAYGVIYSGELSVKDDEVAFIKVESVQNAVHALLRFFVASKNINVYQITKNEFLVGQEIVRDKYTLFIHSEDLTNLVGSKALFDDIHNIFFYEKVLEETILANVKRVERKERGIKVLKSTIFHSSIAAREGIFQIAIFKYYLHSLINMVSFFENRHIGYKLKSAVKNDAVLHLGESETVICSGDAEMYDFCQKNAPWAVVINGIGFSKDEALDIIKKRKFGIFVTSFGKESIENTMVINKREQGILF